VVAGHFGFGAIVKSRERSTPLWALMLACQWLDVVFVPLFAFGIERIVPVPGTSGGYGDVIIYADYTHSLVGALLLSVLFGVVAAFAWGRRPAIVLGAVAFSHWIIDLAMHRRDMPWLPGNWLDLPRLGFGMWRLHAVSIAAEAALVVVGWWMYWKAAVQTADRNPPLVRTANLAGATVLIAGLVTLVLNVLGY
jgi:hypothetical protein